MELENIRNRIDEIDKQLVNLFIERMNCSKEVADYKFQHSLPIYDEIREKQLIDKIRNIAGDEYAAQAEKLYKFILEMSKQLQTEQQQELKKDYAGIHETSK